MHAVDLVERHSHIMRVRSGNQWHHAQGAIELCQEFEFQPEALSLVGPGPRILTAAIPYSWADARHTSELPPRPRRLRSVQGPRAAPDVQRPSCFSGRQRRNWWDTLAGGEGGRPITVNGYEFPVLRAAQIRQGRDVTDNALCRNPDEVPPDVVSTKRWPRRRSSARAKTSEAASAGAGTPKRRKAS